MYVVASTSKGAVMSLIGSKSAARALCLCALVLAITSCDKGSKSAKADATEWDRPATVEQLSGAIFPSSPSFDASNVGTLQIPDDKAGTAPLATDSLEVRVFLVGRMAKTEVKQVFRNHTNRQTEGTYSFRLPENASLSRLAMDVEGKMVEGELVEREKARLIYEGIVRKQKDPALLEWTGNNRFSTQLFPIPAKGTKTVILTYEQMLPAEFGQLAYDYSLPNLEAVTDGEKINAFSFTLESEDGLELKEARYGAKITQRSLGGQVTLEQKNFTPRGNVRVNLRMKQDNIQTATIRTARRAGVGYFLADLPINLPGGTAPGDVKDFILAIDTSAGAGKPVVEQSLALARTFIERSSKGARFAIITGDLEVNVCGEGLDASAALACLKGVRSGGASDLGEMIEKAGSAARKLGRSSHTFLIGDGVATIGEMDGELLEAKVKYQFEDPKHTFHTLAMGHGPNEEGLRTMARIGGGQTLRIIPGEPEPLTAVRMQSAVRSALLEGIEIKVVDGEVKELVPAKPMRMAHGEQLGIFGVANKNATLEVTGTYLGKAWKRTIKVGENKSKDATSPQIARFWARGRIADMLDENAPRPDVVALSLEYGVMSPYTSFLVLENQEAYDRYQIERRKDEEANRQLVADQGQANPGGNLAKSNDDLKSLLDEKKSPPSVQKPMAEKTLALEESEPREFPKTEGRMVDEVDATSLEVNKEQAPELLTLGGLDGAKENRAMGLGTRGVGRGGGGQATEVIQQQRTKRVARRRPSKKSLYLGDEDPIPLFGNGRIDTGGGKGVGGKPSKAKKKRSDYQNNYYREELARLEKRKELPGYEMRRVIELHVLLDQEKKARAAFKKYSALEDTRDPGELLPRYEIPESLAGDYTSLMKKQLRSAEAIEEFQARALGFASFLGRAEDSKTFIEVFGKKLSSPLQAHVLRNYVRQDQDSFTQVWDVWTTLYDSNELYAAVSQVGEDVARSEKYPHPALDTLAKMDSDGVLPASLRGKFVELSFDAKQPDASSKYLLDVCSELAQQHWCMSNARSYLGMLEDRKQAAELEENLSSAYQKLVDAMHARRADDMGNVSMIQEIADLHMQLGQPEKARRVLSEIVEFSPHDYNARTQYGGILAKRKELLAACEQYAISVQLDPKQRDTFRSMIALRRMKDGEGLADKLRDCVVDGVSKLPVKRSLSLVLTWEDPSADVDLHIHENNGQDHVWYRERESANGGLLYYDITDGYGPEIYVLGSGPVGEYSLGLVYYSGSTQNIKAQLTVLRDAGSVNETRKTYDVLLPRSDSETEYSVTKIQFDEKDRSIDGSKVVDP
jgi:tetratricopeptide (TPR) repeat protein